MRNLRNSINNNQGVIAIAGIIVSVLISLNVGKWIPGLTVVPGVGKPIFSALVTMVPIYLILAIILVLLAVIYLFLILFLKYSKLTIISARYGASGKFKDMAAYLNKHIKNNKLNIRLTNAIIGYDPAPHTLKTCAIKYRVGKKVLNKIYEEDEIIKLPTIKDFLIRF